MARVMLWAVALLMAALALVAGCVNVDIPDPPAGGYVQLGNRTSPAPSSQDRSRVSGMSREALQDEVLRLSGENARLRREVEDLKRRNKLIDEEKDRLEDRVEALEKQLREGRRL